MQKTKKVGSNKMLHYICPICGDEMDPSEFYDRDHMVEHRFYSDSLKNPVSYEQFSSDLPAAIEMGEIETEDREILEKKLWCSIRISVEIQHPGPKDPNDNDTPHPLRQASAVKIGKDHKKVHVCSKCVVKLLNNEPLTQAAGKVEPKPGGRKKQQIQLNRKLNFGF